MEIPMNLKHKPVLIADDYTHVDGRQAGVGDAQGLSLGLAQWNDRGKVDISAKVWRYTGEKWSRQSEEMPLHRVLDLAIFLCRSLAYLREAYRYADFYDPQQPQIDRIPLQGDAMTLRVATENPMIGQDIRLFLDALAKDDELLGERLELLSDILNEMGYGRRKA